MQQTKNLGVWLDHASAKLIDLDDNVNNHSIVSSFDAHTKEDALSRSENIMHNKEHQMHEAFYKKIADVVVKYNHVLLFGPTDAKDELHNYMKKDLHFKDIKMDMQTTDKMTDIEKYDIVKKHFKNA
ncbi:MAG: hypothetical protein WCP57_10340 [Bacteroidota bacterium]